MNSKQRKSNGKPFWAPGSFCRRQRLKSMVTMLMATLMVGLGVTPPAQGDNLFYDYDNGVIFAQPPAPNGDWFNPDMWYENDGGGNGTLIDHIPASNDNVRLWGAANYVYIQNSAPVTVRHLYVGWNNQVSTSEPNEYPTALIVDNAGINTLATDSNAGRGSFRIGYNDRGNVNQRGIVLLNNSSMQTRRPIIGQSRNRNFNDVPRWRAPIDQFLPDGNDQAVFQSIFGLNDQGILALPSNKLIIQGGRELGTFIPTAATTEYAVGVNETSNLPASVSNGPGGPNVILPFGPYIPQGASKIRYEQDMFIGNQRDASGMVVLGHKLADLPATEFFGNEDVPGNNSSNVYLTPGNTSYNQKEDFQKLRFYSLIDHRGGNLMVGNNGVGVMIIDSGMLSMRSGQLRIGNGGQPLTRGLLVLNNGYIRTNGGQIRVGQNGNGTFLINGGRVDVDQDLRISNGNNSNTGAHGNNRLIMNDGILQIGLLNQGDGNANPDTNRDLVIGQVRGQRGRRNQLPNPLTNQWPKSIFEFNGGNVQISRDVLVARNNNAVADFNANGGHIFIQRNLVIGNNGNNTQRNQQSNNEFGTRNGTGIVNFGGTTMVLGTRTAFGTESGVNPDGEAEAIIRVSNNINNGNININESGVLNILPNAGGRIRGGFAGILSTTRGFRVGNNVSRGIVNYNDGITGNNAVLPEFVEILVGDLRFGVDPNNSNDFSRNQTGNALTPEPLVRVTNLTLGDNNASVTYTVKNGTLDIQGAASGGSHGNSIINVAPTGSSTATLNKGATGIDTNSGIGELKANNGTLSFEPGFNFDTIKSNTPWRATDVTLTGVNEFEITPSKAFIDGDFAGATATVLTSATDAEWTFDTGGIDNPGAASDATWSRNNPVGFMIDNNYSIDAFASVNDITGLDTLIQGPNAADWVVTPDDGVNPKNVSIDYAGAAFRTGATVAVLEAQHVDPNDDDSALIPVTITRNRVELANYPLLDPEDAGLLARQLPTMGLLVSGVKGSHVTRLEVTDEVTLQIGQQAEGLSADLIIAGLGAVDAAVQHGAQNGLSGYEGQVEQYGGTVDISGDLVFGFETKDTGEAYGGEGGLYRLRGGELIVHGAILNRVFTDFDATLQNNDYAGTLWTNGGKLTMKADAGSYGYQVDNDQSSGGVWDNDLGSINLTNFWVGGDQTFGEDPNDAVTKLNVLSALRSGFSNGNLERRNATLDFQGGNSSVNEGETWTIDVNGTVANYTVGAGDTEDDIVLGLTANLNIPNVAVYTHTTETANEQDDDIENSFFTLIDTSVHPDSKRSDGFLVSLTSDGAGLDPDNGIDGVSSDIKPINFTIDGANGLDVNAIRIHTANDGRDGDRTVTTIKNFNSSVHNNQLSEFGSLNIGRLTTGNNSELTTTNLYNVDLYSGAGHQLNDFQIGNWGGTMNVGDPAGNMPSIIYVNDWIGGTNREIDIDGHVVTAQDLIDNPDLVDEDGRQVGDVITKEDVVLTSVFNINPNSTLIHADQMNIANNNDRIGYVNVKGYVRHVLQGSEEGSLGRFHFAQNNGEGIFTVSGNGRIDSDSFVVGGDNDGSIGRLFMEGGQINLANASETAGGRRDFWVSGNNRGFVPQNELGPGEDAHDANLVDNQGYVHMSGGVIRTESSFLMARGNSELHLSNGRIEVGVQITPPEFGIATFTFNESSPNPSVGFNNFVTAFKMTNSNNDGGLAYINMTGGEIDTHGFDVAGGRGDSIFHYRGGVIKNVQDWITQGDKYDQYADRRNLIPLFSEVPAGDANFILDFNRSNADVHSALVNHTLDKNMRSMSTDNMQIGHDNDATQVVSSNTIYMVRKQLQLGGSTNRIDGRDVREDNNGNLLDHNGHGELFIASHASQYSSTSGQYHILGDIVTGDTGSSTLTLDDLGTDGIDWAGRGIDDPTVLGNNTLGINAPNFHIQLYGDGAADESYDSQGRRKIVNELGLEGGGLGKIKRDRRVIDGEEVKFTVATGNIDVNNFNIGLQADAVGSYVQTQGLIQADAMHLAADAASSGTFNANVTEFGVDGQAIIGAVTSGAGTSAINVSSANGDFLVGEFVAADAGTGGYSFDVLANKYVADPDPNAAIGAQDFDFVPGDIAVGSLNIGVTASTSYTQSGGTTDLTGNTLNLGDGANVGTYNLEDGTLDLHGTDIAFANAGSTFNFTGGTLANLGTFAVAEDGHNLEQAGGILAVGANSVVSNDYSVTNTEAEVLFDFNDGAKHLAITGNLDAGGAILRIAAPTAGSVLSEDIVVASGDTKQLVESGEVEIMSFADTSTAFDLANVINEATPIITVNAATATSQTVSISAAYNTWTVDGTLDVNAQAATVNEVYGSGVINNGTSVTINGLLSPGSSPGTLDIATDNLTLGAGSTLLIDIWGTTVDTEYDQLQHSGDGAFDLGGSSLSLNFEDESNVFFIPQNGDVFDIITYGGDLNNALLYGGNALQDNGTKYDIIIDGEELQFLYTDNAGTISLEFLAGLLGDFDGDDDLDLIDVDMLSAAINLGDNNVDFDMNEDGLVNAQDGIDWLNNELVGSLAADFDLNLQVDVADLSTWATGFATTNAVFSQGDADFNGQVDVADLSIWATLFGQTGVGPIAPLSGVSAGATAIPEPGSLTLLGLAALALLRRRRQD